MVGTAMNLSRDFQQQRISTSLCAADAGLPMAVGTKRLVGAGFQPALLDRLAAFDADSLVAFADATQSGIEAEGLVGIPAHEVIEQIAPLQIGRSVDPVPVLVHRLLLPPDVIERAGYLTMALVKFVALGFNLDRDHPSPPGTFGGGTKSIAPLGYRNGSPRRF